MQLLTECGKNASAVQIQEEKTKVLQYLSIGKKMKQSSI